jgi:hypothetical protein
MMQTRPYLSVLIAVLLQAGVLAIAPPASRAEAPLLLIDRETIASHSGSTGSDIASQTARVAPGQATDDGALGALLGEIVASVRGLLLGTQRLLLEILALCLRVLALASPFQTS